MVGGLGIGRRVIGGLFVGGADGFAPGIGVVGVDVFVLGEGQDLDEGLAEIGEGGGGATTAKSRSLAKLGIREKQPASEGGRYRTPGALGAIALAGLKTRHYNLRAWKAQRYGWPTWRGVRQWRPSTNMNEHKEERSLERLVDMEVSRKKIRFGFLGSLAEARRTSEQEKSTRGMIVLSR